MSPMVVTLRDPPARRIDLSPLSPQRLQHLRREAIGRIPLQCGNRRYLLRDLFTLEGDDPGTLVIRNTGAILDGIGAFMRAGRIRVEGDAGDYVGLGMAGGSIDVHGDCGHWLGSAMTAGRIRVDGDCGDFAGGARPGERRGMAGGTLVIRGRAGDRLGERMRRGQILVTGSVGDYCGARMLAGTIAVMGQVGVAPGYGMHRGTLLLRQPATLTATFADCGVHELDYLRLLFAAWRELGHGGSAFADAGVRARRYVGDLATGGQGELLVPPD